MSSPRSGESNRFEETVRGLCKSHTLHCTTYAPGGPTSQQQYPQQQPGWGGPQQPFGQPPFAPPPPKKADAGKVIGLGCLGLVGLSVLIALIGAVAGGGSGSNDSKSDDDAKAGSSSTSKGDKAADAAGGSDKKADNKVVVFKVWGTAPVGALGPIDITYGSDSDSRDGTFKNGSTASASTTLSVEITDIQKG